MIVILVLQLYFPEYNIFVTDLSQNGISNSLSTHIEKSFEEYASE